MPLAFLIDENLRGRLIHALLRHADGRGLDVLQVGDAGAPVFGTKDDELLLWTESHERLLISNDRSTLPLHLARHLSLGRSHPGILLLRGGTLAELASFICLIAIASEPSDWNDRVNYVP